MIHCNNFNENICAYIDNELTIEERLSFEEHARSCRECKRELDEMVRVVELCTGLPQQELPADFKAELHEKLVAVAQRQDRQKGQAVQERQAGQTGQETEKGKVTEIRKPKGFLLLKTFAAVAAGLLLVFLAGSYFKFGLFSPMKAGNTANSAAMAMEQQAVAREEAGTEAFDSAADTGAAGDAGVQAKAFGAMAPASEGTAEIDRSAAAQNRDMVIAEKEAANEVANSKISTLTVTVDDPAVQSDKIKLLAEQNNGEVSEQSLQTTFSTAMTEEGSESSGGSQYSVKAESVQIAGMYKNEGVAGAGAKNSGTAAQLQLDFIIPATQYDQFVAALNTEYGAANVQPGAFVTEDVTEELYMNIAESNELDNRIQELQKEDSAKNTSEITKLKAKKETADKRIDELRLGNDFVNVTVFVNGK